VTIINKGIGGDIVTGHQRRWTDDVLRHKPDWLSIMIGINDLHTELGNHPDVVTPEIYENAYDDILCRTKERLPDCGILLIEPFYISMETSPNSLRHRVLELLPAYIRVVHQMSEKHETRLVKTHEMFMRLLRHHDSDTFCPEPIHPNPTGHLAIAEEVYAALSK